MAGAMERACHIVVDGRPVPDIGPLDALLRITTATICCTDIYILKGEYPVVPRLMLGHGLVGGHREARVVRHRLSGGAKSYRQRYHAERPQQCVFMQMPEPRWTERKTRLQGDLRLEIRQHD